LLGADNVAAFGVDFLLGDLKKRFLAEARRTKIYTTDK
jgi:hypothetical protein